MAWLQIKFNVCPEQVDEFSDLLVETGAVSVTLEDGADQAIFEPPPGEIQLWQQTRIVGLYADTTHLETLIQTLISRLAPKPLPGYTHEILEDKVWERVWMEEFHPICFGEKLWICPSWRAPPHSHAINIKLDPGLAFGTGTHPTTSLCLKWLDANPPKNLDVIDYGCGSGILAVAAAMLQATKVWAIDHDPQAIQATMDNARNNQVEHLIHAGTAEIAPTHKVDLLLANILAQPLIEFAPIFADMIKPHGRIVLSGILNHQADRVTEAFQDNFEQISITHEDEWVRITATRKP